MQEIFQEDEDTRLEFAETFLNLQSQMPNLLENIIWSDEAVFHLGGFVNRHNSHYWAQENPKKLLKKSVKAKSNSLVRNHGDPCNWSLFSEGYHERWKVSPYVGGLHHPRDKPYEQWSCDIHAGRSTSSLCEYCSGSSEQHFPRKVDWTPRTIRLASTQSWPHSMWFLSMGLGERSGVQSTDVNQEQ